jgi:hypothetical protein
MNARQAGVTQKEPLYFMIDRGGEGNTGGG